MRDRVMVQGNRPALRRAHAAATMLLAGVVTSACTARVAQFGDFAQAGTAYVKASEAVLDEAGTASIRANNATVIKTREAVPPDKRLKEILTHNELLKQRLVILQDIRRHGRLLQRYFEALAALAGSNAPQTAAAAAQGAVSAHAKQSPEIKSAKIGAA